MSGFQSTNAMQTSSGTQLQSAARLPVKAQTFAGFRCFRIVLPLLLTVAWLSGGTVLLTRTLWMDEVHSWLLLTDPDQTHALNALANGVDFNPPGWFLATRWISGNPEVATELQLRLISLLWTVLAIGGLSLLLSKHFDRSVCVAAIVLTMSQSLLVNHSTELRFYGFWSAGCIWICVVLQWQPAGSAMRASRTVILAALCLAITTTHYFGVLSLSLISLPVLWNRRTGWLPEMMSIAAGTIVGLFVCLQYLPGQKSALTRPTWISPTTISDTIGFLQSLLPAWQLAACLVAMAFSIQHIRNQSSVKAQQPGEQQLLLPLIFLGAMPLLIVLVAWCVQPALVTRYALTGLLALAPVSAVMIQKCGPQSRKAVLAIALLGFAWDVNNRADQWVEEEQQQAHLISQLRRLEKDQTIVFEDRIVWMPVLHHYPEFRGRCHLADFGVEQMKADSSLRVVQRDVGRQIAEWYPIYSLRDISLLPNEPAYYVVPYVGGSAFDLKYSSSHAVEQAGEYVFRRVLRTRSLGPNSELSENRKETF